MDFNNLDILDEFFGTGGDSNPFMMLIWFLPIILFVFYGQRIQLIITSREIKKNVVKNNVLDRNTTGEVFQSYSDPQIHIRRTKTFLQFRTFVNLKKVFRPILKKIITDKF